MIRNRGMFFWCGFVFGSRCHVGRRLFVDRSRGRCIGCGDVIKDSLASSTVQTQEREKDEENGDQEEEAASWPRGCEHGARVCR